MNFKTKMCARTIRNNIASGDIYDIKPKDMIYNKKHKEKNKDKNFFIHCSAGISRSQAFVLFIQNTYFEQKFELNPTNPCISPNGHVYSKLCEAYRIKNNIISIYYERFCVDNC